MLVEVSGQSKHGDKGVQVTFEAVAPDQGSVTLRFDAKSRAEAAKYQIGDQWEVSLSKKSK